MTAITKLKVPASDGNARAKAMTQAFPEVDPGERPLGSLVLLQIKQAMTRSAGGIVFTKSDIETEFDNTQVAKVLALAPLAYHTRDTMQSWPEGDWVKVGDYVRISQHNGKRFTRPIPGTRGLTIEDRVTFVHIDDLHIASVVDDPLDVKAFF